MGGSMNTLIENLEQERESWRKAMRSGDSDIVPQNSFGAMKIAIDIVKQHSDWIDVSVEPKKMTETESEAVLAIDENGYSYNVALADVTVNGIEKREWVETKAKWNGEFWEAVEYVCPAEGLVAYKHIPKPTSEVAV